MLEKIIYAIRHTRREPLYGYFKCYIIIQDNPFWPLILPQCLAARSADHDRHLFGHVQGQTVLDDGFPINQAPVVHLVIIRQQSLHPLFLQDLLLFWREDPLLRELVPRLRLVVSEVEGHVLERVLGVLCLGQQLRDGVAEEALVLGLRVEVFAGHLDDIGVRIVARTRELNQLRGLHFSEFHVTSGELDDDFVSGRVRFAEVGGVAETEGGCGGGRFEGTGEFCVVESAFFDPYHGSKRWAMHVRTV